MVDITFRVGTYKYKFHLKVRITVSSWRTYAGYSLPGKIKVLVIEKKTAGSRENIHKKWNNFTQDRRTIIHVDSLKLRTDQLLWTMHQNVNITHQILTKRPNT